MRRTLALVFAGLVSIAAAAVAYLFKPAPRPAPPDPAPHTASGPLSVSAQLERRFLPERDARPYLEVDVTAAGSAAARARVPVNAVLILDRSGSMSGEKIEQARAAARALIDALGEADRIAVIAFDSDAQVLVPSAEVTPALKEIARRAVASLEPMGETNLSSALALAGPELSAGKRAGRVDEVFIASDGRVTDGELDLRHLVQQARSHLGTATLSTFGIGEDYDEELMSGLASAGGGRMQFIQDSGELPRAFASELGRATRIVGTQVRLRVRGLAGAEVARSFGYETEGGWLRLPDFASGDERRVLLRLAVPRGAGATELAAVELEYLDAEGAVRRAQASVQATFTSDASNLAEPAGRAAVQGARAEMAELARAAAVEQEAGNRAQAVAQLRALDAVAAEVASSAPAVAAEARMYERSVSAIGSRGDVAAKSVKQKAFDAVRAPVAGW